MNERLKEVRKSIGLNQAEFGKRLGVGNTTISKIEIGENNLTEQMIVAICREYAVNEEWLRTGSGNMFNAVPTEELDRLAERYNLPAMAKRIVKAFVELEADEMDAVMRKIKEMAAEDTETAPGEDDSQVTRINGLTEEEEHELVRRRHADVKRGMPSSMISGNINHA